MTTSSTPTPDADPGSGVHPDRLLEDALHRVWGFSSFRPLQREAMHAILESRDSVVVLPTGGGKSLCFQAPAVVGPPKGGPHFSDGIHSSDVGSGFSRTYRQGVALVVSPLIS